MLSQECLRQDSQTQELSQNSLVISWPLCYCQDGTAVTGRSVMHLTDI